MGEHPAQVIAMYLMRRNEITRTAPVVVFCGPTAKEWVTGQLIRHLQVRRSGIQADSVLVVDDCPDTLAYGVWAESSENRETVWVASMTFGRFRSEIVAFAKPYRHPGEPPYARGRLERFIWDHRIVNAGTSLTFSEFQPPH